MVKLRSAAFWKKRPTVKRVVKQLHQKHTRAISNHIVHMLTFQLESTNKMLTIKCYHRSTQKWTSKQHLQKRHINVTTPTEHFSRNTNSNQTFWTLNKNTKRETHHWTLYGTRHYPVRSGWTLSKQIACTLEVHESFQCVIQQIHHRPSCLRGSSIVHIQKLW